MLPSGRWTGSSTFAWSVGGPSSGQGSTYVVTPEDLGHPVTLTETFSSLGNEDRHRDRRQRHDHQGNGSPGHGGPSFTGTARSAKGSPQVKRDGGRSQESPPRRGRSAAHPVSPGDTYLVTPADLGKTITVTETFTSPGYDVATSAVTSAAVIAGARRRSRPPGRGSPGPSASGSTLKAVPGTWPVAGASTLVWSVGGTDGRHGDDLCRPGSGRRQAAEKLTETLAAPATRTAGEHRVGDRREGPGQVVGRHGRPRRPRRCR